MRKLHCREVSGRDCEWELVGDTDDEVMKKAVEHDEKMHGFHPTPDDEKKMREAIRG